MFRRGLQDSWPQMQEPLEYDIVTLMNEDIIEDQNRVKFIGFKRESKDTHPLGLLKDISRFVLHPSGEVDIIDSINCLDRDIKQYENSSLELNIWSRRHL